MNNLCLGTIYILDQKREDILAHEAAHARHLVLDPDFSRRWKREFGNISHSKKSLEELGILNSYASKQYTRGREPLDDLRGYCESIEHGAEGFEYTSEDGHKLTIDVYPPNFTPQNPFKAQDLANNLVTQFDELPRRLRENAPRVIIIEGFTGTTKGTFVSYFLPSRIYNEVTEDITTHTGIFHVLLKCARNKTRLLSPIEYQKIQQTLENRLTQKRAITLGEAGFLDQDYLEQLRTALETRKPLRPRISSSFSRISGIGMHPG